VGEILFFGELTYPTLGKGKSSSKVPFCGDMLVPWRVLFYSLLMMRIVYYSDVRFNTVLKRGAKAGALSQGFQGAFPHFAATAWVILL